MKKWLSKAVASVLVLSLLLSSCTSAGKSGAGSSKEGSAGESQVLKAPRLEDDFYEAVNYEWLSTAEIPPDEFTVGGFTDIGDRVDGTLRADFAKMMETGVPEAFPLLGEFLKFYKLAGNFERQDQEGTVPILPYLEQIEGLNQLEGFPYQELIGNMQPLPFQFFVMADMGNAQQNALYIAPPSLFLPDKSYYEEGNASGEMLLPLFEETMTKLLVQSGKNEQDAARIAKEAVAFDKSLVPLMRSSEEEADFGAMYNPKSREELAAYSKFIPLADVAEFAVGQPVKEIIVTNPAYFESIDQVVNEGSFSAMKSWMMVQLLNSSTDFLGEAFRETYFSYDKVYTGQTEILSREKVAYTQATTPFGQVVGDYYGRTYLGEEAKTDVTEMVNGLIAVYKVRLQENDWLSPATKAEAIKKLDHMAIQIGFPDQIPAIYSQLSVDESKGLFENAVLLSRVIQKDNFSKFGQPVNRGEWGMPAHTVNAMYSPLENAITFPAAILQAPFYSLEQSDSANYGGIGAVIAHEISHAFDPNGAKYDENGNLKDWWTKEDYAAFEERTAAMEKEFDGLDFSGGKVNGKLTLGENVADAGGLSCALDVVKSLPDSDLDAFFRNWATIWRSKTTPQVEAVLLEVDTHAPDPLRANIQLQNLAEFFQTYGIQEGDQMYRAPEDRVSIW